MPRKPASKPVKKHQIAPDARAEVQASRQLGKQHDLKVASTLKAVTLEVLARVRFGKPLEPAQAPRPAPEGKTVAPNGDPLLRVKLADGDASGSSQYALISPRTNQFYKEDNLGGLGHTTHYFGPLSLPRGSQFSEKKHHADDLEQFERAARNAGSRALHSKPALLAVLATLMKRGDVAFDGQAMPRSDVLSETVLKKEHPYTYVALVSKEDPRRITIKKVLTGGFVPAGPDDGIYSQSFTLK
jgi:hypothetical protein